MYVQHRDWRTRDFVRPLSLFSMTQLKGAGQVRVCFARQKADRGMTNVQKNKTGGGKKEDMRTARPL